jgi:hypothetical protein
MKADKINLRIYQTNEAYRKADIMTKRVMIMEDLLLRIKISQFRVTDGLFLETENDVADSDNVKELLEQGQLKCTVCAKGGLFMTLVGRENELNGAEFHDIREKRTGEADEALKKRLNGVFDNETLDLIEIIFEGADYPWNDVSNGQVEQALIYREDTLEEYNLNDDWSLSEEVNNVLLEEIAKNIITNKGKLVL